MPRIGKRWHVGDEPPKSLPAEMIAEIRDEEQRMTDKERAEMSWTMSYLEGLPEISLERGGPILKWSRDMKMAYWTGTCG